MYSSTSKIWLDLIKKTSTIESAQESAIESAESICNLYVILRTIGGIRNKE